MEDFSLEKVEVTNNSNEIESIGCWGDDGSDASNTCKM